METLKQFILLIKFALSRFNPKQIFSRIPCRQGVVVKTVCVLISILMLHVVPLHAEGSSARQAVEVVGDAFKKTAQTSAREAQQLVQETHTLGGKFLQGIINIMIAASPGKTRVWLPAPSTDPNSGLTIGILPVFLFVDAQENVRHILAPSVTHNDIFGVTTTMRYYFYPKKGAQFFAFASGATKSNYRLALRYEDPQFLRDWFYFKMDYNFLEEGSFRFFGFGPRSSQKNEVNYTFKENHLQASAGLNFLEYYRAILTNRFRLAKVTDGPIKSLAQISSLNPHLISFEDNRNVIAQRITLERDTRDLAMAPQSGTFNSIFLEKAGHLGGEENFVRYGAESRAYFSKKDGRFITASRLLLEEVSADELPFFEQSLLGGKDSLRGYGDWRFADKTKTTISIEERILFYRLSAFNVNVDFEVAPFYEGGTLARDVAHLQIQDWRNVYGVGFRSIVRPSVVGVVEMGFSDEGLALFVGIDYPF